MNGVLSSPMFLSVLGFLFGAVAGRFLNRCIERFPRQERLADQLATVASRKPDERLLVRAQGFGHRLPIIGWLLPGHPLRRSDRPDYRRAGIELANALLCAAIVWMELPAGLVSSPPDPFLTPDWEFLTVTFLSLGGLLIRLFAHLVLVQALLAATVIDLDYMIIPDGTTLPAMAVAFLLSLTGCLVLVPVWFEDGGIAATFGLSDTFLEGVLIPPWIFKHPSLHGLAVSVAGFLVGGGTVWAVRLIGHWALGREAMGFGDVVLMAMIGAFIGWQPVLVVFFLAPVCALVVVASAILTGSAREFPYGPWLSLATIALLLFWNRLWPAAGGIFFMGRMIPIVAVVILILLFVLLFLMRLVRGGGWAGEAGGRWNSADQLTFLSQENPPPQNTWQAQATRVWPGVESSRGTLGETRWRGMPNGRHWPN